MICKGKYTWGFFHQWGKWTLEEREKKNEFLTGATLTAPVAKTTILSTEIFQFRQCSRCDKHKAKKLA